MADKRVAIAVFDFDGTITRRDSLLPFLVFTFGWFSLFWRSMILVPTLAAYALQIIDNSAAKERVIRTLFGGMSEKRFADLAEGFAANKLPVLIEPRALARIGWHHQQGHRCIIVSASLEDYLLPWAKSVWIDEVLATRLQRSGTGAIVGKFVGGNCYGTAKVERLRELLGDLNMFEIYAYGDSKGDHELMAVADHAYYRDMPEPGDE